MEKYRQLKEHWNPASGTEQESLRETGSNSSGALGDFRVHLEDPGPNRIQFIRALRSLKSMSLRNAKELSDSAPVELASGLGYPTAQLWINELTQSGAIVQLCASAPHPELSSELPTQVPEQAYPGLISTPLAPTFSPEAPLRGTVHLESMGQWKIKTVKVVYKSLGCSLRDAKQLVESAPVLLGENLGPQEAEAFVRDLRAAGASAYQVAQDPFLLLEPSAFGSAPISGSYTVQLQESSLHRKILLIKNLRELMGIGLKEAKQCAEQAPISLRSGLSWEEAEHWVQKLKETGAVAIAKPDH